MTLNWIGTRTQENRAFDPAGLGRSARDAPESGSLLARGSLLIEIDVRPRVHPVNLIRFGALDPWPTGLTICLEPDGTVRLMMRQGARHLETALKTNLGKAVQTAHITYTWDAPSRSGRLSAYVPDHGLLWQTNVLTPFPLSTHDAHRILMPANNSVIHESIVFAAIADAPCPHGPVPGLDGSAAVDTPKGPKRLSELKSGDLVEVQNGPPVRALWVGKARVPALGRFAPMTLRSPYMGLWDDLVAARDQRVCLSGSEVEYLFGEECVATAIRHLEARNCAESTRPASDVMTYYQVLLQTHEIMTVNGALVESFDGSAVLGSSVLMQHSVLADMAPDTVPRNIGLVAPVLQGYEALTLTGVTIG